MYNPLKYLLLVFGSPQDMADTNHNTAEFMYRRGIDNFYRDRRERGRKREGDGARRAGEKKFKPLCMAIILIFSGLILLFLVSFLNSYSASFLFHTVD